MFTQKIPLPTVQPFTPCIFNQVSYLGQKSRHLFLFQKNLLKGNKLDNFVYIWIDFFPSDSTEIIEGGLSSKRFANLNSQ